MNLLIVKTSSMGDVVHALPAVSDIAAQRPGVQIDWLVEARFAALPEAHPAVRRVLPMKWRAWRKALAQRATWAEMAALRDALRAQRYDAVIDLQGLIKSALWAAQAHGPVWGYDWGSAREPLATLGYARKAAVPRAMQAVARNRALAAALLGYALPTTPPVFGLARHGERAGAVLIPMASRAEKLWPEADWIELGRRLVAVGHAVRITWGSEAEQARAQRIAAAVSGAAVTPFWSVADAVRELGCTAVAVGLDTGLTHIAAAQGAATVGIYCDHEPALAGLTGDGYTASLGGVGQRPSLDAVWQAVSRAAAACDGDSSVAARPPM